MPVAQDARGVAFDVLVTPRAARERIGPVIGERLKIAVCAPPVDGEANAAVCAVLARALGVPRSAVTIVHGDGGRRKRVHIAGVNSSNIESLINL